MDNTGESKFLLFDSICLEIIGVSAPTVLGGSVDEIVDPDNLPDPVKNLIGKTYMFLVNVEKENIWDGKETYKVSKVLVKDGLLEESLLENSYGMFNPKSIVSGDQGPLMLEYGSETTDSMTPSSKRVYPNSGSASDQSSTSKKLCIEPIDLEKSNPEFGHVGVLSISEGKDDKDEDGKKKGVDQGSVVYNSKIEENDKIAGVKVKVEKKK
ncbi:PREDICTED: uncharacterized protein LOC104733823 [Camelina sativa]|uniref:Uncharacterized protein LOC104733823 n=1 Tax=Camelina sativa TaxID=90675 RepID=A0ABM0V6K8_CAMSA|nr:PREDICTED: uncharacterized protein LOC104733823 [Camelina sativa]